MLRLRALRASDDFDAYWTFHVTQEHRRTHRACYAQGTPPDPIPPPRARLQIVK